MNIKKVIYAVFLLACLVAVFSLGTWFESYRLNDHISKLENTVAGLQTFIQQPSNVDFSLFWDAYSKLQQSFIDPAKITNQKVIYGAIQGMTNSLGDPYTDFFNPAQAQLFKQDLSGSFDGIGVEIGIKKDLITIISPIKGSPGEKAGLRAGDIIVKINGKDSTGMMSEEAVSLIRGPKGTPVTLSIVRDGLSVVKDIKIIRDTIKVPIVEWSLKNGDVAYIQMYQFDEVLPADFEKIVFKILQSPAKKIVLDLRNNPGGYLEVAQTISGWFLPKDQVVTIEDFGKGKEQRIYKTTGSAALAGYPTVVLINQGSASASEILAGSLRDNRNIKLVGEKSFGKGCVQEVVDLKGGSFLKITIANWLTPKGNSISDVGLTPDVKVDITEEDIQQKKDPQLDKALEIVGNLK